MGEVRGFAEEDHYFDELGALVVDYYRTSDRITLVFEKDRVQVLAYVKGKITQKSFDDPYGDLRNCFHTSRWLFRSLDHRCLLQTLTRFRRKRRWLGADIFWVSDMTPSPNAQDSVLKYRMEVFFDAEVGNGLSLDRVGMKDVDLEVISFLTPLGHAQANRKKSKFRGWATIKMSELERFSVQPTKAEGEENPYHAELSAGGVSDSGSSERARIRISCPCK